MPGGHIDRDHQGAVADSENPAAMLPDELAALDPHQRREVAKHLRKMAENFAEVPEGKTTSHVLGVLARLLDHA